MGGNSKMAACVTARGTSLLACALSVAALVCLLAGPTAADPNNLSYGVFFAHSVDPLVYSSDPPPETWCGAYAPYAIYSREQVDPEMRFDGSGTIWYILAAWEMDGGQDLVRHRAWSWQL